MNPQHHQTCFQIFDNQNKPLEHIFHKRKFPPRVKKFFDLHKASTQPCKLEQQILQHNGKICQQVETDNVNQHILTDPHQNPKSKSQNMQYQHTSTNISDILSWTLNPIHNPFLHQQTPQQGLFSQGRVHFAYNYFVCQQNVNKECSYIEYLTDNIHHVNRYAFISTKHQFKYQQLCIYVNRV